MGENHSALHCHDLLEAVQGNLTAVLPGKVQQQRGEHLIKNTRTCRGGADEARVCDYCVIQQYTDSIQHTHQRWSVGCQRSVQQLPGRLAPCHRGHCEW